MTDMAAADSPIADSSIADSPPKQRQRFPMDLDLHGRVRNMPFPQTRPLLPLFEAVVNSIQAMRSGVKGSVTVEIERQESLIEESTPTSPIVNFKVTDNGVGFTKANFESFRTSDSRAKANMGGKGVGRMLWIKAFQRVEVTSVYKEGGETRLRSFAFSLEDQCIVDHDDAVIPAGPDCKTTVYLKGLKPPYARGCPRGTRRPSAPRRPSAWCATWRMPSPSPTRASTPSARRCGRATATRASAWRCACGAGRPSSTRW